MSHPNAFLTPTRPIACWPSASSRPGWPLRRAAERFQLLAGHGQEVGRPLPCRRGAAAMLDRPSRPHFSPEPAPDRRERRIIKLRFTRRWGPHRIAAHLQIARSTVQAVLRRYRMPLLRHLDQNTGLAVRRPNPVRYEHSAPGDLVHVDIKKLGRIPDGGGHRKLGRTIGNRHNKKQGRGYAFLHHAVDDHSRLAYSEILGDERKETAAGFWTRAKQFFAEHGIVITRVLTRQRYPVTVQSFSPKLSDLSLHTRRPAHTGRKPTGKSERFNRTLTEEWAYAADTLPDRRSPRIDLPRLAASLQSPPTPHRHRRTVTRSNAYTFTTSL